MSLLKLCRLFYKGLDRNFKIIRYGDVPDIYNTPVLTERYPFSSPCLKGYILSSKELAKHLIRHDFKKYELPDSNLIYCGGSANNEREFTFVTELVSKHLPINNYAREQNLSFAPAKSINKTKFEYVISIFFYCLSLAYFFRIKLGPVSLKYLITYSKIFLNLYLSIRRQELNNRLLLVANDHTDFPVAASMISQCFNVPVLYVQHAEVSGAFPPLNFDISILRNQKSLDTYRSIGPVSGDVYIIPRNQEPVNPTAICHDRAEQTNVVIYLSSVFNQHIIQECINVLRSNPNVLSIGIKTHPRGSRDFIDTLEGIEIHDSIPSFKHVAIVPNSSVVIELLELGIPVFQYFDLDDVGLDYYGFVREGITPEVDAQNLKQSFWLSTFYDDEWIGKFESYSPAVTDSWRDTIPMLTAKIKAFLG